MIIEQKIMGIQNRQQEMMFLGMNEPVDTGKKCSEEKLNYAYLNNQVIYGADRFDEAGWIGAFLSFSGFSSRVAGLIEIMLYILKSDTPQC